MSKPVAEYLADRYRFYFAPEQVLLEMDRVHEGRGGELAAEVTITTDRSGAEQLLHAARLNLMSTTGRASIVKALAARIPEEQMDWGGALEYACHAAVRQWREGDPVIDLHCVGQRPGTRFLLEPFVEQDGATVLFSMGGIGKSMFALAIAVSVATGVETVGKWPAEQRPVLYLDWEADKHTHADRMRAIGAGRGVEVPEGVVHYRRQFASLAEAAPHLRRVIADKRIGLVVVDSMGAARGGEPESADSTIRLFNAARSLDVPWIGVDHVTKNGGEGQTTPFGSIFTHNLARLTWSLEQVENAGNGAMTIALTNQKANNGRLMRRQAYTVEFREDAEQRPIFVEYSPIDAREVPGIFKSMSQSDQIAEVLRRNRAAMLVEDILKRLAEEGVQYKGEEVQIRAVLNKFKGRFVPVADGAKTRWGLLASDRRDP